MIGYAADDVAKPSLRVDVVQASGLDEGVYDSGAGEHARLWGVSRRELPNMIVIAHPESWVAPLE